MTRDEFLRAIIDSPDDDAPRLVFADWLDEHGETERAEFIRARVESKSPNGELRGDWVEQWGLPLTWTEALSGFRMVLGDTIAWCRDRERAFPVPGLEVDLLRHPKLRPPEHLLRTFPYPSPPADQARTIWSVVASRSQFLARDRALPTRKPATSLAGGRLLIFHPDATLLDGAAQAESDGFFDEDNVPGWDTWVMFAGKEPPSESYGACVVCWIPPHLLRLVERGITVNPEECIRWATDVDNDWTRKLREVGLLA
jgi:uncharacterized protein (TIGR02996 family)